MRGVWLWIECRDTIRPTNNGRSLRGAAAVFFLESFSNEPPLTSHSRTAELIQHWTRSVVFPSRPVSKWPMRSVRAIAHTSWRY